MHKPGNGFTVIELIVVLILSGIVVAMASPNLAPDVEEDTLTLRVSLRG